MRRSRLVLPVLVVLGLLHGCRGAFDVDMSRTSLAATGLIGGVRVRWVPVPDAVSYAVYLSTSGEAFTSSVTTTATTLDFPVSVPASIAVACVRDDGTETALSPAVHVSAATFYSTAPDDRIDGNVGDYSLGSAIAVGDVNGDGFGDLVAGAPFSNGNAGQVWVRFGSASGLTTSGAQVFTSFAAGANTGYSLASGKFDDDGYDDVLVGALRYTGTVSLEGGVALFHGSPTGLVPDDTPDFLVGQTGGRGGTSVLAVDLDENGVDDIVMGAHGYNGFLGGVLYWKDAALNAPVAQSGANLLGWWLGAGDVIANDALEVLVGHFDGNGRVELYTGSNLSQTGTILPPPALPADGGFGRSFVPLRSFLGDGHDEIAIGAYLVGNATVPTGAGWVGLFEGGDLLPSPEGWFVEGDETNEGLGFALASADVDGDGFPELLVGAPGHHRAGDDPSGAGSGRIVLHRAGPSGLGPAIWQGEGDVDTARLGESVAFGDLNGDGYPEAIAGAPQTSGAVRVWLAHPVGPLPVMTVPQEPLARGRSVEFLADVDDPVASRDYVCAWDFGDLTPVVETDCAAPVEHAYESQGLFEVRLRMTAFHKGQVNSSGEAARKIRVR